MILMVSNWWSNGQAAHQKGIEAHHKKKIDDKKNALKWFWAQDLKKSLFLKIRMFDRIFGLE